MYDEDDVSISSDSELSPPQIEKRQYHNLLEKNRRNVLKFSFLRLKNAIPSLAKKNLNGASRAKILRRSIEFIRRSELKRSARDRDIRDLKAKNMILENQIRAMESVTDATSPSAIQSLLQRISETDCTFHPEEPPTDSEEESNEDSDMEDESRYSEDDYDSPSTRPRKTSSDDDVENRVSAFYSSQQTGVPSQLDTTTSDSETSTDSEDGEN